MTISFPYMESSVVYYKLFEMLGHEVVAPPRPTQKTFKLGVKYAPEFSCFPFKVILGNMIELHEMGVDTIFISGGYGPCRAGYYGPVQKKLLNYIGLDTDVIIFEQVRGGWKDFLNNVRLLKKNASIYRMIKSVYTAYKISVSMDSILKLIHRRRPYARDKSRLSELWDEFEQEYLKVESSRDIERVESRARERIEDLEYDFPPESERLRVGIVGEIYVVMEGSTNNYIEEMLNEMGVEVERSHYLSEYIESHMIPWKKKEYLHILDKGEKYLEIIIGGHAKRSIGHIVDYKERGFDGAVHLKPFGCLPEIISQSMLDRVSQDLNIPILPLSIDEQMGETHTRTRLEAFLDLIRGRKEEQASNKQEK